MWMCENASENIWKVWRLHRLTQYKTSIIAHFSVASSSVVPSLPVQESAQRLFAPFPPNIPILCQFTQIFFWGRRRWRRHFLCRNQLSVCLHLFLQTDLSCVNSVRSWGRSLKSSRCFSRVFFIHVVLRPPLSFFMLLFDVQFVLVFSCTLFFFKREITNHLIYSTSTI